MKKYNALSAYDKYKLFRWVEDNKDRLTGMEIPKVAKLVHQELGLTVTVNNIRSAYTAVGVPLRKEKEKDRVEALEERIIALEFVVAQALTYLLGIAGDTEDSLPEECVALRRKVLARRSK